MSITLRARAVTNFCWEAGHAVPVEQVLAEDPSCGRLASANGQFASHQVDARGTSTLVRDEIGVNKLFFSIDAFGGLTSSNYRHDFVGTDDARVWSVPAGHVVRVSAGSHSVRMERWSTLEFATESPYSLTEHAVRIRARLDAAFRDIRGAIAGRPLYVTLSGGLDSTTIAVLARELIGDFTAVTFDVGSDEADKSSDMFHARRVARELGVPFLAVSIEPDDVLALLDTTLIYGQDFRDFNVHCGLVNAAIAAAIEARHPTGPRPVVLTGDCMNELLADYAPESYRGQSLYPLPQMPAGRLRRHLVAGLDAGDREVGIFAQRRIDVIQPYALCAREYAALPDAMLDAPHAKAALARAVMGATIPEHVYERPKVRAQVGGAQGGTMRLLLDLGIDGAWLVERFAALFQLEPAEVRRSIRAGRYRTPTPTLADAKEFV
jgi:asparagine synthetase B (glutamine-hydrolysing)